MNQQQNSASHSTKTGDAMKRNVIYLVVALALLSGLLGACNPGTSSGPTATPGDRCSAERLPAETRKVNDLMREFDDITFVANLTPQAQLTEPILQLQGVRRRMEDLDVPPCLQTLRLNGVNYMNAVISYLAHFMGGAAREQVNGEIIASQTLRVAFESEMARLIGATYVPPPTMSVPTLEATPTLGGTPDLAGTEQASTVIVTNSSGGTINVRSLPDLASPLLGYMMPGDTAKALARTEDGTWLIIEFPSSPNGMGCVYTELVQVDGPVELLPFAGIATNTPFP